MRFLCRSTIHVLLRCTTGLELRGTYCQQRELEAVNECCNMLISKSSQSSSRRISFSEALATARATRDSLEALPHEPLRMRSTSAADTDAADEELQRLPSAGDSLSELERPARSGTLASQTSSRSAHASRAGTRSLAPPADRSAAAAADDDAAAAHCICRRCPPAGCYTRAPDGHYRQCFCVRCFSVRQMFQYHFISWRVLVQKYVLETYSISEHNAATTLQSFDLRRLLISLFIKVCINTLFLCCSTSRIEQKTDFLLTEYDILCSSTSTPVPMARRFQPEI